MFSSQEAVVADASLAIVGTHVRLFFSRPVFARPATTNQPQVVAENAYPRQCSGGSFAHAFGTDVMLLASEDETMEIVVLYEAPWDALARELRACPVEQTVKATEFLRNWIEFHRTVLDARERYGRRLSLVNISDLDATTLATHFLPRFPQLQADELLAPVAPPSTSSAASAAHAKAFEAFAPTSWDMYEALESCATLFGREPQFRYGLRMSETEALNYLTAEWHSTEAHDSLLLQLNEVRVKLDEEIARTALIKSRLEADRAQQELELHKVRGLNAKLQDELNIRSRELDTKDELISRLKEALSGSASGETLAQEAIRSLTVRCELQRAELDRRRTSYDDARANNLRLEHQLQVANSERDALASRLKSNECYGLEMLAELHHVQEKLEEAFLENQTLRNGSEEAATAVAAARRLIVQLGAQA